MGQVKRMLEDALDFGFSVDEDIFVCPDCFEEEGIQDFIRSCGGKDPCTYCGRVGEGNCTLEELLCHAFSCIITEWGHPADEGLPYETREGGWQGKVIDTWELLYLNGFVALNDALQEKINSSILDNEWCERDPYSLSKERSNTHYWLDGIFEIRNARS